MCGFGGIKKQPSRPIGQVLSPEVSGIEKLRNMFHKKEPVLSIDQFWYRGLPNIARYCLWPIMIGNQLHIDKVVFDALVI